jgi:arginase family enzyme
MFHLQGTSVSKEDMQFLQSRGGRISWLKKDLRSNTTLTIAEQLKKVLDEFQLQQIPVVLHVDAGALDCFAASMANSANHSTGISLHEFLDIGHVIGQQTNVSEVNWMR